MAKHEEAKRTRMSDSEVEKFIAHFAKEHDLKGKELDQKLRHAAATRLAALERYARKHAAAPKKATAKKGKKAA